MTTLKTWIPLAVLALLLSAIAPTASAASEAPDLCTDDVLEAVAVCVTRAPDGRTCVIAYVGTSAPVNRCASPRQVTDAVRPCAEFATVPAGVCVSTPQDYVCVTGHWGHYPIEECVYVGPASASAVSVKLYCVVTQPECVGYLACVYATKATPKVCVPDPCYTTSCWSASAGNCVVIVPEGGDMGEKVCWDLSADCKVWYERTTFLGTTRVCLVGSDGGGATQAMGVECMDRYWEQDVVVGRVVSRSSCEYEVCFYDETGACGSIFQ
jgi:hypothetical protein